MEKLADFMNNVDLKGLGKESQCGYIKAMIIDLRVEIMWD